MSNRRRSVWRVIKLSRECERSNDSKFGCSLYVKINIVCWMFRWLVNKIVWKVHRVYYFWNEFMKCTNCFYALVLCVSNILSFIIDWNSFSTNMVIWNYEVIKKKIFFFKFSNLIYTLLAIKIFMHIWS